MNISLNTLEYTGRLVDYMAGLDRVTLRSAWRSLIVEAISRDSLSLGDLARALQLVHDRLIATAPEPTVDDLVAATLSQFPGRAVDWRHERLGEPMMLLSLLSQGGGMGPAIETNLDLPRGTIAGVRVYAKAYLKNNPEFVAKLNAASRAMEERQCH